MAPCTLCRQPQDLRRSFVDERKARVLLSLQVALLGAVTLNLRAVGVH